LIFGIFDFSFLEQVSAQKKLLDQEQTLYTTLLGHWQDSASLAESGVTVNFSTAHISQDFEYENGEINSDPLDTGPPEPKKSRSSLRRKRKSARVSRSRNSADNETGNCLFLQKCKNISSSK